MSAAKKAKTSDQTAKTPGTLAVEKYRPKMNALSDAERQKLLAKAMVTIYAEPQNAPRR